MRARCELLFNFGREKPSSSLRPRGFCPGERVRSRRNVKPERALLCREGSGRVLGSTLKLTPLARSPRFLVSRPLVKGVGVFARTRGRRERERRRDAGRNTGCVFRCAITMAVCILITRHRRHRAPSSFLPLSSHRLFSSLSRARNTTPADKCALHGPRA